MTNVSSWHRDRLSLPRIALRLRCLWSPKFTFRDRFHRRLKSPWQRLATPRRDDRWGTVWGGSGGGTDTPKYRERHFFQDSLGNAYPFALCVSFIALSVIHSDVCVFDVLEVTLGDIGLGSAVARCWDEA